jgi:hypothetical protein
MRRTSRNTREDDKRNRDVEVEEAAELVARVNQAEVGITPFGLPPVEGRLLIRT